MRYPARRLEVNKFALKKHAFPYGSVVPRACEVFRAGITSYCCPYWFARKCMPPQ